MLHAIVMHRTAYLAKRIESVNSTYFAFHSVAPMYIMPRPIIARGTFVFTIPTAKPPKPMIARGSLTTIL